MTKKRSSKVPLKVVGELQHKSNLLCCVCKERGEQIHHLNGKNYDHRLDNLVYLCFRHHDEATRTGGLSRKLSREAIIRFRDQHYMFIEKERQKILIGFDHKLSRITEEDLLTAAKNANIIIEIEKAKQRFYEVNWNEKNTILSNLSIYSNHANPRLGLEVFNFLNLASSIARSGMTYEVGLTIHSLIIEYLPNFSERREKKQTLQLAKQAVHIGHEMIYDAFIYLQNFSVAMCGLTIIKYVYRSAKKYKLRVLENAVAEAYRSIRYQLNRPEREDLKLAQELVNVFEADLKEWDLSFPPLPVHLQKLVDY